MLDVQLRTAPSILGLTVRYLVMMMMPDPRV